MPEVMMHAGTLRLDILRAPQRRLWDEFGQVGSAFVLYGGTALALRLGHRQSEDFDFFSSESFSPSDLRRRFGFLGASQEEQASPNTFVGLVDCGGPVRVSFFGGLDLNRVEDPELAPNGVCVASLLDLAGTKVKALRDRADSKDYLDISAFLKAGVQLSEALAAALAIYGPEFNPLISLKALTFFGEGDLRKIAGPIRAQLEEAAASVNLEKLPRLRAKRGLVPGERE